MDLSQCTQNLTLKLTKYKNWWTAQNTFLHIYWLNVDHIQNIIDFHHDYNGIVPTFYFSCKLQNAYLLLYLWSAPTPKPDIVHVHPKHIEPQTNVHHLSTYKQGHSRIYWEIVLFVHLCSLYLNGTYQFLFLITAESWTIVVQNQDTGIKMVFETGESVYLERDSEHLIGTSELMKERNCLNWPNILRYKTHTKKNQLVNLYVELTYSNLLEATPQNQIKNVKIFKTQDFSWLKKCF